MANEDMSTGMLNDLEYRAKAIEHTSRIEESQITLHQQRMIGMEEESRRMEAGAEAESRREMGGDGNAHFSLYSDLALEASGISPLLKAGKDLYALATDNDPGKFSINGKKIDTFEDKIKNSAKKGDGLHADAPKAKTYATDSLFGTPEENKLTLSEKFGQINASMSGAASAKTSSWNMKAADSFSTEAVQRVVNEHKLASQATLDSVAVARRLQAPAMGMGGGMMRSPSAAPTVSLAAGPKAPSFDAIDEESMVS